MRKDGLNDNYVPCPNLCCDGFVKHYPDTRKSLFIVIKCPFCKGAGVVTETQKTKIEEML